MRKPIAVAVMTVLLLALAPPARATEVIDRGTGYYHVALAGWTRGYHHVAFIARYNGRATDIFTSVSCANGFTERQHWNDSGPRFRYVVRLPVFGRCWHTFRLRTGGRIAALIGAF